MQWSWRCELEFLYGKEAKPWRRRGVGRTQTQNLSSKPNLMDSKTLTKSLIETKSYEFENPKSLI
jgi:hypothetical protein